MDECYVTCHVFGSLTRSFFPSLSIAKANESDSTANRLVCVGDYVQCMTPYQLNLYLHGCVPVPMTVSVCGCVCACGCLCGCLFVFVCVFVCLCQASEEGQAGMSGTDERSRWQQVGVDVGSRGRARRSCPFTLHVPSVSVSTATPR